MKANDFDETEFFRATAERRVRALVERQLSREEAQAALQVPISESERAEILQLIRWFCRRYPTPGERLAYVRRAYFRWQKPLADAPAS